MTRDRLLALLGVLVSVLGGTIYWFHQGDPSPRPQRDLYVILRDAGPPLLCGLWPALPAGVRSGLGLADPVQEDGTTPATQSGLQWTSTACLPGRDGLRYVRAVDVVAEIGVNGGWTAGDAAQCNLARVMVEKDIPPGDAGAGDAGGDWLPQTEVLCQMCGAPPGGADGGLFAKVAARVEGQAVELLEKSANYANPGGQPAVRCDRRPWIQAAINRLGCACCARGQACTVAGEALDSGAAAGVPGRSYRPASRVSGAGKRMLPCGEHAGVAAAEGLNYLLREHAPACL